MAEETTTPVQTAPDSEPVPEPAPAPTPDPIPAPVPEASGASGASRKGSPLLVFLTVLLILVGIADVILWGVVGYYFLQNHQSGGEPAQAVSAAGGAAGEEGASGDAEGQDALAVYIQEMEGIWERHDEEREYHNRIIEEMDDAEFCAEFTRRIIPNYRQVFEDAAKVTSDDPQVAELCEMFQEYGARRMGECEAELSVLETDNWLLNVKTKFSMLKTNSFRDGYWKKLRDLAEERGVPFDR